MFDPAAIRPHMEVVTIDGKHVGTIDRVEGQQIRLKASDPDPQGAPRYLSFGDITVVDDKVRIKGWDWSGEDSLSTPDRILPGAR